MSTIKRLVERAVQVRPDEIASVLWAFLYFFSLMCGYSIIKPVRDAMGLIGGGEELPWMFTATLGAMLVAVPIYSFAVARVAKRKLVPLVYHFFTANIVLFAVILFEDPENVWVARIFFVWVSVYNVFVVSVFWSFMSDLFSNEQGRRLFAFIAGGGTVGMVVGPAVTAILSQRVGIIGLLVISLTLLQVAAFCAMALVRTQRRTTDPSGIFRGVRVGGSIFASLVHVFRSPYLLSIAMYVLIYTVTSTVLYFQRADIVSHAFESRLEQTAFFSQIDLTVNLLTLALQMFVTARLMRVLGVAAMLAILPVITAIGFASLSFAPVLMVIVLFQSIRSASNYALTRPTRELLYTVVSDEDKYKSKSLIDTVIYRAGDTASSWAYTGIAALGLGLSGIALLMMPLAAIWLVMGIFLGRKQEALKSQMTTTY